MKPYKNIFKITHHNLYPSKGNILISEPFLRDIYFQRSVVLLVEDSPDDCTLGLVLNKKTSLYVNDYIPELKECPDMPIYVGGPCSPNRLFFMHTLGDKRIPGSVHIKDNLFFAGKFEALKEYLLTEQPAEGVIQFFLGYSNWTKDQLNGEIDEGSWIVSTMDTDRAFTAEGDSYWKETLMLLGKDYEKWANFPIDPLLN